MKKLMLITLSLLIFTISLIIVNSTQTDDPIIDGYSKVWQNPPSKLFLYIENLSVEMSNNYTVTLENNFTGINSTTQQQKNYTIEKYGEYLIVNEDGKIFDARQNNAVCRFSGVKVECDSISDGNGDGICQQGESCIVIKNNKIEYSDQLGGKYQQKWETQSNFKARKIA